MAQTNKLSQSDIIDIRRYHMMGTPTNFLADKYDVSQRTIQRIIKGEMWASVPVDMPLYDFEGKYELTADGRIWSLSKNEYISTQNGKARLTSYGRKVTVNIEDMVKEVFV